MVISLIIKNHFRNTFHIFEKYLSFINCCLSMFVYMNIFSFFNLKILQYTKQFKMQLLLRNCMMQINAKYIKIHN